MKNSEDEFLVKLTGHWGACPGYWRNFIRTLNFDDDASYKDRDNRIASELAVYGACRIFDHIPNNPKSSSIIFESGEHYLMFVLRFG